MARRQIDPEHKSIGGLAGSGEQVIWVLLPGEDGTPMRLSEYKDKTWQIIGQLERGDVEGTNDPAGKDHWTALRDDDDNELLNKQGLFHVKMNPLWVRPVNRKSQGAVTFNVVATH